MNTKRRYWTESEAAEMCEVPNWKLKYLRETGRISPMKVGRALIYSETDVVIARALIDAQGARCRRATVDNDHYIERENE